MERRNFLASVLGFLTLGFIEIKPKPKAGFIRIDDIFIDPKFNIRGTLSNDDHFQTLVKSIKNHGIIEQVLVRKKDHRLIHGYRRVHAARILGHQSVPVKFWS